MKLMKIALMAIVISSAIFAEDSQSKVLVAFEKTPYKEALTTELVALLEKSAIEVVVVDDHKADLKSHSAETYDAVFISNSGVQSKVRPWVKEWLAANNKQGPKIVLHTTKTKKWTEQVEVDAVSSASDKDNAKADAQTYFELITAKLNKE